MQNQLRPFWNRYFTFNWKFGLFLVLLICIPRFIVVLHANFTGTYSPLIALLMTCSALAPFLFLSKYGRNEIGLRKPQNLIWLLAAVVLGLLASFVIHLIGQSMYGSSDQNWYQYIGKLYKIPSTISMSDKKVLFGIIAIPSMIFSPIGEELFFRGLVHASFSKSFGEKKAALIDGLAFAITHLSHFGIVCINQKWDFFVFPAILWVMSMFLVSLLFFTFRKKTNSIFGAILCHAAFNLGMTYCIFYLL